MRIIIVCYPTFGGSGILATELGHKLSKNGHTVHFIAYQKPVRLEVNDDNIFFHKVNVPFYPLFNFQPYELALSTKIVDVSTKHKIDLVHVHYAIPHAYAAYMAQKMLKTQKINLPIVTTLHGTDITLVGKHPFYKKAVKFSIDKSNIVTSVSKSLKTDTHDFFETNKNFENVLDLILSGRYERLDNNSSFDPRISFKYLTLENFFFRGSFGTSFTAPSMAQMFSSEIQLGSVRDINDSPFVRLALLGNQYLKPATSENINFGFQWNVTNELDLIIDYWKIDYKNRIEVESPQVLLNTDPFAPSVTRNQFGELIAVSTSYFNEEKTELSGIDAEINFLKIVEIGELSYSIKATKLSKFLTPENQGGDNFRMVNRVGNFNFDANTHSLPKLRLNSFFSWAINDLRIGINSRYVDGYSNDRQIPASAASLGYTNYVKSFLVHDFSIIKSFQLSSSEIKFGMGIINAFDKKAPLLYDAPDFSFDTRVHDPRGRLINLTSVSYTHLTLPTICSV